MTPDKACRCIHAILHMLFALKNARKPRSHTYVNHTSSYLGLAMKRSYFRQVAIVVRSEYP